MFAQSPFVHGGLLQSDRHGNTQLAFDVAAEHLGIPVRIPHSWSGYEYRFKRLYISMSHIATPRGRGSV